MVKNKVSFSNLDQSFSYMLDFKLERLGKMLGVMRNLGRRCKTKWDYQLKYWGILNLKKYKSFSVTFYSFLLKDMSKNNWEDWESEN